MASPESNRDLEDHQRSSETALVPVENEPIDYYVGFPSFSDFGGLDQEINQLHQSFVLAQHPQLCEKWDVDPVKGLILYGPGGVGKTALVRALARETESAIIEHSPSSILSEWVGKPVQNLKAAFDDAADNEWNTILFFDEFDGLFSKNASGSSGVHASLISEMKVLMNNVPKHVTVIAAANNMDNFDPALLRAGRFDTIIQIPLPNSAGRLAIFTQLMWKSKELYNMTTMLDSMSEFVAQTDNMSGADIKNILKTARTKRVMSHLMDKTELNRIDAVDIMSAINQHRTSRPS